MGKVQEITEANTGVWVDSYAGQFAVDEMILAASSFGFEIPETISEAILQRGLYWDSNLDIDTNLLYEIADEAEMFLNELVADKPLLFGWSDGDFWLAAICEEEQRETCDEDTHWCREIY